MRQLLLITELMSPTHPRRISGHQLGCIGKAVPFVLMKREEKVQAGQCIVLSWTYLMILRILNWLPHE